MLLQVPSKGQRRVGDLRRPFVNGDVNRFFTVGKRLLEQLQAGNGFARACVAGEKIGAPVDQPAVKQGIESRDAGRNTLFAHGTILAAKLLRRRNGDTLALEDRK